MVTVVLVSLMFLAFFNGTRDSFKGVATLYGSGAASYRSSITWVTIPTGAMLAPAFSRGM
jgi:PiT family inorganic phosphate transporter